MNNWDFRTGLFLVVVVVVVVVGVASKFFSLPHEKQVRIALRPTATAKESGENTKIVKTERGAGATGELAAIITTVRHTFRLAEPTALPSCKPKLV